MKEAKEFETNNSQSLKHRIKITIKLNNFTFYMLINIKFLFLKIQM